MTEDEEEDRAEDKVDEGDKVCFQEGAETGAGWIRKEERKIRYTEIVHREICKVRRIGTQSVDRSTGKCSLRQKPNI